MTESCSECGKNLRGHPKIRLDGRIYCYRCAKTVVLPADHAAEQEFAGKLKDHEEKIALYKAWDEKRKRELPSLPMQVFIFGAVTVGLAILVPPLFCLGPVIGFFVNMFYVEKKKHEWNKQNPQPIYPSYPSSNSASSRIELVGGGTKGRQISGDYRQQILERDGYQCQNCGKIFPADQLEVHHVKSRAKRGKNFSTNLVTLCFDCHLDESWLGHSHYMRKWYRK